MIPVVFAGRFGLETIGRLAWPWDVPLGTGVTVAVGILASLVGRVDGRSGGQNGVAA